MKLFVIAGLLSAALWGQVQEEGSLPLPTADSSKLIANWSKSEAYVLTYDSGYFGTKVTVVDIPSMTAARSIRVEQASSGHNPGTNMCISPNGQIALVSGAGNINGAAPPSAPTTVWLVDPAYSAVPPVAVKSPLWTADNCTFTADGNYVYAASQLRDLSGGIPKVIQIDAHSGQVVKIWFNDANAYTSIAALPNGKIYTVAANSTISKGWLKAIGTDGSVSDVMEANGLLWLLLPLPNGNMMFNYSVMDTAADFAIRKVDAFPVTYPASQFAFPSDDPDRVYVSRPVHANGIVTGWKLCSFDINRGQTIADWTAVNDASYGIASQHNPANGTDLLLWLRDGALHRYLIAPSTATVQLSADRSRVSYGDTVTLSWSASNATTASIDNGIGTVPTTGQQQIKLKATTTFTITAIGPGGAATAAVTVTVAPLRRIPLPGVPGRRLLLPPPRS